MPGAAAIRTFKGIPLIPDELVNKAYVDARNNTFARVVKKLNQTLNNSTTFQDDDELSVMLTALKRYGYLIGLFYDSNAVADFKYRLTIAGFTEADKLSGAWSSTSSSPVVVQNASTTLIGDDNTRVVMISGRIRVGASDSPLTLEWAQNVSNALVTTVFSGSYMIVWEELP